MADLDPEAGEGILRGPEEDGEVESMGSSFESLLLSTGAGVVNASVSKSVEAIPSLRERDAKPSRFSSAVVKAPSARNLPLSASDKLVSASRLPGRPAQHREHTSIGQPTNSVR